MDNQGPGLPSHIQGYERDRALDPGAEGAPCHIGFTSLRGFAQQNANCSSEGFSHGKGLVKYLQAFRQVHEL